VTLLANVSTVGDRSTPAAGSTVGRSPDG
jgi:hypothetical protein